MLDCLTADSFPLPSCRKVKAVFCPDPQAGLFPNIAFGAAPGIAYIHSVLKYNQIKKIKEAW